ncbi:unnamed protein product, partial [Scytosiphon promiscuus]
KALASTAKVTGKDGGIMKYVTKDEAGVHSRLILGFIVGGHKAMSVVEEEHFAIMLRGFARRPNLVIPCRRTVSTLLAETAIVARIGLKELVRDQKVSLTCDGWTLGNEIPMMAVTAHWINKDWELKSACLSVFELTGSHTGTR